MYTEILEYCYFEEAEISNDVMRIEEKKAS